MSHRYRFGSFELDAAERRLTAQGQQVALTRRAFDTLLVLVRNPGRLVTREELISAVWGETIVEEGNLHWTISVVRRALVQASGEPSGESWIETVRGLGYRFTAPVETVAEEIPEAAPAVEAEVASVPEPLPQEEVEAEAPVDRALPRSRLWLAIVGAAVLLTIVAWTVASRRDTAEASTATGIAVVGFRNLSPQGADGWVGTALTEMLAADLAQGGRLRLVPSDDVASMRRDLGLQLQGPMGRGELAQVRRRLGSEWVIVGSYLRLEGQDPPLRVDALLRHTGSGETRLVVSRRGRETELFTLADSLAGDLRRALAGPREGADAEDAARHAMPATPQAQRLYAEGLERLQRMDAMAAAERLKKAVEADPDFSGAWLALARAYELLGFDRQAEDAAVQALQRSKGLPERQRLSTEAVYLRIARRLPDAIEVQRRLYELSHHAFEEGLALVDTLHRARRTQEAQALIAALREEHPADREDARLAMFEAAAFDVIEDQASALGAAERTIAAARRQGMVQIEARALSQRAISRIRTGTMAGCRSSFEDLVLARRKAEPTGDRFLLASVLQGIGVALSECNRSDTAAQEKVAREAIALYREVGALGRTAPLLFNLGSSRLEAGDLLGADHLMREALETCQTHGIQTRCRERFLHPLGANRMHRGEISEARRMLEEGLRANLQSGNRNRAAEAQSYLPDLAALNGDLARAIELQRQVLALRQEIGAPEGIAWAQGYLADLLAEAGHGSEALEQARQAAALAARHGDPALDAYTGATLAMAHLASGDLATADRESARAFTLLPPPRAPLTSFSIWSSRVRVLLARGQLDAAEALIDEGLRLARSSGFVAYELEGRLFRAQLAQARGRSGEARQLARDLASEARVKGFLLIARHSERIGNSP